MSRGFDGYRLERMWGKHGGDGELARRLVTALRALLEAAPVFDEMQGRGQRLTTWESARYREVKRRGWEVVKEAERLNQTGA